MVRQHICCGADKQVDPANVLSFMRASTKTKTMKGTKRQGNRYNKSDDFIVGITNVCVKSMAVVCSLQLDG